MLTFPDFDPILLHIGPVAIRWYALAYIAGLLIGWQLLAREAKRATSPFSKVQLDDLLSWCIGGIIIGGRLGYVVFYNPGYYVDYPLDIPKIWQGGMSFHGGMLGVVLAIAWYCRRQAMPFLPVMDRIAFVAPIGIGLGRIANFINGELVGRTTDVAWGMVFPHIGPEPRHPSQLYEAFGEGVLLFLIVWALVRFAQLYRLPGAVSGLFLLGYGVARFVCEFFRQPDIQLGFIVGETTMGQLLTIPMMLVGAYVIMRAIRQHKKEQNKQGQMQIS